MKKAPKTEPLTLSVPEAASRYFGIRSKAAAYQAAHAGQIPTLRIGRLLRVPVRSLERMLDSVSSTTEHDDAA